MSVKLSPMFCDAQLDSSGNPGVGFKLYTYTAGSTTPQTAYQDSGGASAHTNPIILNARGEPPAPIWLTSGIAYKFELQTAAGVTVRTVDNVAGINDTTTTAGDQWVAGPTPTYINATSFSLVGDQTSTFHVGRRLKTTNSGGTVYSTISISAFGATTTVTVVNDSGTLDSGLSAVYYGILTAVNPSNPVQRDDTFLVADNADPTKQFALQLSGITTGTKRTGTMPDKSGTFAMTSDLTVKVLAKSGAAVSCPADTTEDVLATITVAAGTLGANGRLRISTWWTLTSSGNNKTLRVRYSTIAGSVFGTLVATTVATVSLITDIWNKNSTGSQAGNCFAGAGTAVSIPAAHVTASVDTTASTTIIITGQKASSGETLTLDSYLVELIADGT